MSGYKNKNYINKTFSALALLFVISIFALAADNPTVYFSPDTVKMEPAKEFEAKVFLDSDLSVNAFDLEIIYSTSAVEFLGIDTKNSIVDVWAINKDKTASGTISLGGGMIKAFKGEKGEIASLRFKQKIGLEKTAYEIMGGLRFSKSDFYYADGKGTKVVAKSRPLSLTSVIKEPMVTIEKFSLKSLVYWLILPGVIILILLFGYVYFRKSKRPLGP